MSVKPALLQFKFENFADLSSEIGHRVRSETLTDCNGNKWGLHLYPGGVEEGKEGYMSLYLSNRNEKSIGAKFTITIKQADGGSFYQKDFKHHLFVKCGHGGQSFIERSKVVDATNKILKDGALFIDVALQVKCNKDDLFQPSSGIGDKMLDLFHTGDMSDVKFNVGGKIFHAHSLILHTNAPILANYIHRQNQNDGDEVKVEDTTKKVFELVLEYIYSGHNPRDCDVLEWGKDLINAANKFELVSMKIAVENILVQECVLDKENVADYLLFADAQSCPLLKEYSMEFFLLHYREILKSEHSKRLRESGELLSEIMMLMSSSDDDDTMTVNELRRELNTLGLDVDGSKEVLLSRLDKYNEEREETSDEEEEEDDE